MRACGWSLGRVALLILFALYLVACATPPAGLAFDQSAQIREGRFALTAHNLRGEPTSLQGRFRLYEAPGQWQLDLMNPLGATLARLTVTPSEARLRTPDAPDRVAISADGLLADVLGAPVPANAMRDWLGGRVLDSTSVSAVTRDNEGRISAFVQAGWQVALSRYDGQGPRLLSISGQDQGRPVSLRLVVEASGS
jgi:outer membrane lipoprotein LolB